MNPWRIANKLRGECSYHTPIRVVLTTKKLSMCQYTGSLVQKIREVLGSLNKDTMAGDTVMSFLLV
jgi:hypothetical protein